MVDDERYSRQHRFPAIGPGGQARLAAARVVVVGCGALGTAALDLLARAGVGHLRCIDRDFVERSNLQRQCLYDEDDARASRPKAVAAQSRLAQINSAVTSEAVVAEVQPSNVKTLIADAQVVIDGSDNFRTRHVVNEACCQLAIPWMYGACVGSYGLSLPIIPGSGPCLRCLQDQLPAPGETPTCDTVGVIGPIVHLVAAEQVAETLKLLVGAPVRRELWTTDLWLGRRRQIAVERWRDPACAACGAIPTYPALTDTSEPDITVCGREAIQIRVSQTLDPMVLAARFAPVLISANAHLVRWKDGELRLTAFTDGRVLVHGAASVDQARAAVDRGLG